MLIKSKLWGINLPFAFAFCFLLYCNSGLHRYRDNKKFFPPLLFESHLVEEAKNDLEQPDGAPAASLPFFSGGLFFVANIFDAISSHEENAAFKKATFPWLKGFVFAEAAPSSKKDLYELLGVSRDATKKQIKDAYKKKALELHPDVSESPTATEDFAAVSEAHKILMNDTTQKIYDSYGFEGLENMDSNGHADPFDPFSIYESMFKGFGRPTDRKSPGAVVAMKVHVTLEDLYFGNWFSISYNRPVLCANIDACLVASSDCKRAGMRIISQQVSPGLFFQKEVQDDSCVQNGKAWKKGCKNCPNGMTNLSKVSIMLHIEAGSKHREQYEFADIGEEAISTEKGKLSFVVHELPHERFSREGDDLLLEYRIDLLDALVGFEHEITHLNKSPIIIKRDEVTWDGEIMKMKKLGMPIRDSSGTKGDLLVTFKINYPTKLSVKQQELIKLALGNQ